MIHTPWYLDLHATPSMERPMVHVQKSIVLTVVLLNHGSDACIIVFFCQHIFQ